MKKLIKTIINIGSIGIFATIIVTWTVLLIEIYNNEEVYGIPRFIVPIASWLIYGFNIVALVQGLKDITCKQKKEGY